MYLQMPDTEMKKLLPWRLFDPGFRKNRSRYIIQCLVATLVICLVLLALDTVTQTVLISALGASTFICFTMPHVKSSEPRYLVGGYIIGTCIGGFISLASDHAVFELVSPQFIPIIFGAVATGLAIFVMVLTDTEHPPAAALALGYVLNEWDVLTVFVILTGIISISIFKEIFRRFMINLL